MGLRRAERVSQFIRREASKIIQEELKDPRIGFITITRVEVTPDLRQARIYFSVYGQDEEKEKSIKGLESARGFIQGAIGRRTGLRYTPETSFRLDQSSEKIADVLEKMDEINQGEPGKESEGL